MNVRQVTVLGLIVSSLIWGTAQGQVDFKFGAKGGVSFAKLNNFELSDPGYRTAFSGGGFFILDFPGIWAIQIEGLYVPKGRTDKYPAYDENGMPKGYDINVTQMMDYIEIPILAKISLGTSPVYFNIGPALAFKLSSSWEINDPGGRNESEDWDDITSNDIGFVFGIGAEFPTSFSGVLIEARYTLGLKDIHDHDMVDLKNRTFLILAGLVF